MTRHGPRRMRAKILILYTGGTVGMVHSACGYVPAPGLGPRLRRRLRALGAPNTRDFDFVEYDRLIDSANMTPSDWFSIARDIVEAASAYGGFIVLHGTDTMAYTASALSYLLRRLERPVIVTGSQVSVDESESEAFDNPVGALECLREPPSSGVFIFFGGRLMRGNRTTKLKATGIDAFGTPRLRATTSPGSTVEPTALGAGDIAAPVRIPDSMPVRIGIIRLYPGIDTMVVAAILAVGLRGVVLECYGMGNGPDLDQDLMATLRHASERGVVIVGVTQCLQGYVDLGLYASGCALAAAGVVGGRDMTVEAAFTKLHYLFSLGLDSRDVARRMPLDLCGEVSTSAIAA